LNGLKESLGKKMEIKKDMIEALFNLENAKPKEMMVPADFAELQKKHGVEEDDDIMDLLKDTLKPKEAAEAVIKARELFVSNPEGVEDDERPEPMTVKEYQDCMACSDSDEDVSEDLDDDLDFDDSSVLHLREKLFKKLEAKSPSKITKEDVLGLVDLEGVPDDEMVFPVDLSEIEGCEDLEDLGEMVDTIGAKEFVKAVSEFKKSLGDAPEDGLKPVSVKELREMIEVDSEDEEDGLSGEDGEDEDDDEDDDEDEDEDEDEDVVEPPTKKAKK